MEQQPNDAAAKAVAFARGLRKNIGTSGRRWSQWPGGPNDLAVVLERIDRIERRLQSFGPGDEAAVTAGITDLRTILEWTTYQSASLASARALLFARKTRGFVERLALLDHSTAQAILSADAEESLVENVRTKNDYMNALAAKFPHLQLPQPLIRLVPRTEGRQKARDARSHPATQEKRQKIEMTSGPFQLSIEPRANGGEPFIFAFAGHELVLAADALPSLAALGSEATLEDAICIGEWEDRRTCYALALRDPQPPAGLRGVGLRAVFWRSSRPAAFAIGEPRGAVAHVGSRTPLLRRVRYGDRARAG